MAELNQAVADFLAQERLAVAGVSREGNLPGNHILRKLETSGYEVFPVNPRSQEVEGKTCYPNLTALPVPVGGVVVATPPAAAETLVRECVKMGIPRVWFHRSFGEGSVDPAAVELCKAHGISVIPGACPMMYLEPVDVAHKCIRWFLKIGGKLPDPEGFPGQP